MPSPSLSELKANLHNTRNDKMRHSFYLLFLAMAAATTKTAAVSAAKGCPYAFHSSAFDPTNSAVQRHAALFATVDKATLTTESMTHGHTIQGITSGVWVKGKAITNLLTDRKLPLTAEAVATIQNPAATGMWDKNGRFDEKVFLEMAELAISVPNIHEKVLTEGIITGYLKKKHAGKDLGTATKVGYLLPVSWEAVTSGSIGELIKYFGNAKTADGKGAITVSRMRQWYENPNSLALLRIEETAAASK
jgi:hypothetical protein